MALPKSTKVWLLLNQPAAEIKPDTFELVNQPIPALTENQLLVKITYFSNDPAQRTWMQKGADAKKMYTTPITRGCFITAFAIGTVIATTSDKFKVGDSVSGGMVWKEYIVLDAADVQPVQAYPGLSESASLSFLGGTAMTAWFGLERVGHVKAGETLLVSGAGGATGSAVVQIAKNIIGCKKVVGIAGGKAKCDWVISLGADECFDYKSPTFEQDLADYPDKFDKFFDNVGGKILNSSIPKIKYYGHIIACGAVAAYNDQTQNSIPNWLDVIQGRLNIHGLLVLDYIPEFPAAQAKIVEAIKEGKFKAEGAETVVETKFEDIPKTWARLFTGDHQGKLLTKLI